jgi:hypothetical protein
MNDFVTSGFGPPREQIAMVRRWIDSGQRLWASESIRGGKVHIRTRTGTGGDYGVDLPPDEAAVLADYAAEAGHPQATNLAAAVRPFL